jgi:D-sedoheptulose 7-phosphate isomerase
MPDHDYREAIRAYLELEIGILRKLDADALHEAMTLIRRTFERKKKIYIFGNGGSAATASHFQNDFNKGLSEHTDAKFNFVCLSDNIATVMAIANDIGYDEIFRFQLRGRLEDGDIVMAISGSGNSPNVIHAVEFARSRRNSVIGLTGYCGGRLKELSDISLHVPIQSMQITEDVHMIFDHLMMSVFYKTLCGKAHLSDCEARPC